MQLRKADIDAFPIRREPRGRIGRVVNGKIKSVGTHAAARIEKLVIPPAWRDVRISADPRSHIQAVGRDEAGRRQYIYHRDWEAVRNAAKAQRLSRLIVALPRIRDTIARDLDRDGDRSVLATAARLVDRLCLRAGHEEYAGEESGRGVATLLRKHVAISGAAVSFDFPGKGKKRIQATLTDGKCARNIARALKQPGRRLFKLKAANGCRNMTAGDLNRYFARIAGATISAKDFRTLRASALAVERLAGDDATTTAERRRRLAAVAKEISALLANTPAVARKSYIHAQIVADYECGQLGACPASRLRRCSKAEGRLYLFLSRRRHRPPRNKEA